MGSAIVLVGFFPMVDASRRRSLATAKGTTRFQPKTIGKVFSWESTIKITSFKSLTGEERGNCLSLEFRADASILPTPLPLAEIGENSRYTHAVHTMS